MQIVAKAVPLIVRYKQPGVEYTTSGGDTGTPHPFDEQRVLPGTAFDVPEGSEIVGIAEGSSDTTDTSDPDAH